MRRESDADRINRFLVELGQGTTGSGTIYLTGGATAVLHGWREMTVDIDLKADPEPGRFFETLASLKDRLEVNVELASPDDFIPALPGWKARSRFIGTFGSLQVFHYDYCAQALAKIERGHDRDRQDVRELIGRGLVDRDELRRLFETVRPDLIRYPAVDPDAFARRLEDALDA